MATDNQEFIRDLRRQLIAGLMARNPRISQRQILRVLQGQKLPDPLNPNVKITPGINPDTGKPWSIGTINSDVQAIRDEARELRQRAAEEWIEQSILELGELKIMAWGQKNVYALVAVKQLEMKLLGYGAPDVLDIRGGRKAVENMLENFESMTTEELARVYAEHFVAEHGNA